MATQRELPPDPVAPVVTGKACGAVPADLLAYGSTGATNADSVMKAAQQLTTALADFAASAPDTTIMTQATGQATVPDLGNQLQGWARAKKTTDTWVSQVGRAFAQAGAGSLVHVVNTDSTQIDEWIQVDASSTAMQQADQLAQQVKQAIDAGDWARAAQLLASMDGQQTDPVFAAELFKQLGAKYTLLGAQALQSDTKALQVYDTALATATNSPGWDPNFTKQLFDLNTPLISDSDAPPYIAWAGIAPSPDAGKRLHDTLLLLEFGSYSTPFLTAAGDNIVFGPYYTLNHGPFDDQPGSLDAVTVFANALARNPSAAYQYLTGSIPPPPFWKQMHPDADPNAPIPRASLLMQLSSGGFGAVLQSVHPGVGQAVANALDAAFSSPEGQTGHLKLFAAMGQVDPAGVSDPVRAELAKQVAAHIADFTVPPTDQTGTPTGPDALVFQLALVDQNGNADQAHLTAVQQAISNWATRTMPTGPLPTSMAGQAAMGNFADEFGSLEALFTLALSRSNQAQANNQMALVNNVFNGIGVIANFGTAPEPLTPLTPAISGALGIWLSNEAGALDANIQNDANIKNKALYLQVRAQSEKLFLEQLAMRDSGFIPASVQAGGQQAIATYLTHLSGTQNSASLATWPELAHDPQALAKAQVVVNLLNDERAQMQTSFSVWSVNGN